MVKVDLVRARGYAQSLRERVNGCGSVGEASAFLTYAGTIEAMANEIERAGIGHEAMVRTLQEYVDENNAMAEKAERLQADLNRHSFAAVSLYDEIMGIAWMTTNKSAANPREAVHAMVGEIARLQRELTEARRR